jgi:hypothetical protein
MPTSEAQKRAVKNWIEKNYEKHLEAGRRQYAKRKQDPDKAEVMRLKSRTYYWANREKRLEKMREQYLLKTMQLQEEHNSIPSPITIPDDDDCTTNESVISDVTDWETVNTSEPTVTEPPAEIPKPKVNSWCHPLFMKIEP